MRSRRELFGYWRELPRRREESERDRVYRRRQCLRTTDRCDGTNVTCQHLPGNAGTVCRAPAGVSPSVCSAICGDGQQKSNEQCDDGNTAAADGCEPDCTITPKTVSGTAPPGGTIDSDIEGDGASALDPLKVTVMTPTGGAVTITREPTTGGEPTGFVLFDQQVVVSAPASPPPAPPLAFTFLIDASLLRAVAPEQIAVSRNGSAVPDCTGGPSAAVPDPCVADRVLAANGEDVELSIRTSAASTWRFAGDVCGTAPRIGCRAPLDAGKAQLTIKNAANDAKDSLQWKWSTGAATAVGDFGNPTLSTAVSLCVYDATGLRARLTAAPGKMCNGKPCWTAKPGAFRYRDSASATRRLQQVQLKAGLVPRRAKIQLKARGVALPETLPLTAPITVQLLTSTTNACWEAIYTSNVQKNTSAQFKAKSD